MSGKDEEARQLEAMRALARLPENATCADCGAKFPRFASITLGVFLCNRCYGIHRNVGAHVTRTKCIGLDTWKAHEVELMRSIGNARAAQVWLGALPPNVKPPSPQSSDAEVEKWIRDKYEKRLYYRPPQSQPQAQPQPQPQRQHQSLSQPQHHPTTAPLAPPPGQQFGGQYSAQEHQHYSQAQQNQQSGGQYGQAHAQQRQQCSHAHAQQHQQSSVQYGQAQLPVQLPEQLPVQLPAPTSLHQPPGGPRTAGGWAGSELADLITWD